MLQLYVLLQRSLRPVAAITKFCETVVFPLDLLSSPTRSLASLSLRVVIALLLLLLHLFQSLALMQRG